MEPNRFEKLEEHLRRLTKKDVCLAFSGGTDSSLLLDRLDAWCKKNNTRLYAVTFSTRLHPKADLETARRICAGYAAEFAVLTIDETKNPEILRNPLQRCYLCKRYLFQTLKDWARARGVTTIVDGTNADDLLEYRPGLEALAELSVVSPLKEAGMTKQEVRELLGKFRLQAASFPSRPCMATRLPYGTEIHFSDLERLEKGEAYLMALGFYNVRLRLHGDILRIEIDKEQFYQFIEQKDGITGKMKELGFVYITLDLEGFRSGSMDIGIR